MTGSDPASSGHTLRRTPREEEQFLCNEALRTGEFDSVSDSEWIALCEEAYNTRRGTGSDPAISEDIREKM